MLLRCRIMVAGLPSEGEYRWRGEESKKLREREEEVNGKVHRTTDESSA